MENFTEEEPKEIFGVPTMLMLPARNYRFKIVLEQCEIRIPRKGSYHELAPGVFDELHGRFNILDENILYCPSVTKVLFACAKYPALEPNQVFAPIAMIVEEEEVILIGQVLEFCDIDFSS